MTQRNSGGSLFERIRAATPPSSHHNPQIELLQSIRRNLNNILNTRSGSCYGSPELGLADLNDESRLTENVRERTGRLVRECILRDEPRITDVMVTSEAEDESAPLALRFQIVAQLAPGYTGHPLAFAILLDSHQHWEVEAL